MQYVMSNDTSCDTSRAVLIQGTHPYVGREREGITADMAEVVTEVEGVGEGVANPRPNKDLASWLWSWSWSCNHTYVPVFLFLCSYMISVYRSEDSLA